MPRKRDAPAADLPAQLGQAAAGRGQPSEGGQLRDSVEHEQVDRWEPEPLQACRELRADRPVEVVDLVDRKTPSRRPRSASPTISSE